jgi:hypothetical protein
MTAKKEKSARIPATTGCWAEFAEGPISRPIGRNGRRLDKMLCGSRYEVYRFGANELVGHDAEARIADFFEIYFDCIGETCPRSCALASK